MKTRNHLTKQKSNPPKDPCICESAVCEFEAVLNYVLTDFLIEEKLYYKPGMDTYEMLDHVSNLGTETLVLFGLYAVNILSTYCSPNSLRSVEGALQ
jgi:hypothetical protein